MEIVLTMIKYLDKMTEVGLQKERESTDCSTKARPHQTDENALSAMVWDPDVHTRQITFHVCGNEHGL